MSKNVYAKFRYAPLRTKKGLEILSEPIRTTTTTTRVAFRDTRSGPKRATVLRVRLVESWTMQLVQRTRKHVRQTLFTADAA